MTGFWALARKELLEQRRSWRFMALAGVFITLALLTTIIPFIVALFQDWDRDVSDARNVLLAFGFITIALGTLLAIIVSMGSLAGERASGTAAMTLKPVTRLAFVAAKFLGIVVSIFAALAIASIIKYVMTLFMFDDGGFVGFSRFMAVIGVYLVFIGSIAFFWSGMFSRQLLAGGIALVLFIAFIPLSEIPHTQKYWPVNTVSWAESNFPELDHAQGPIDEIIEAVNPLSAVGFGNRDGGGVSSVVVEGERVPDGRAEERDGPDTAERRAFVPSPLTFQKFQQLRLELADFEEIDGLAPRILGGELVENTKTRRRAHLGTLGLDPLYLEGFGGFTFTSGGEARLEDLADDEVYINKGAAEELDAEAGDQLLLSVLDQVVTVNVRGVVEPRGLAAFSDTIIIPLQRAQSMMRLDDRISDILVSNRGDESSGSGLSKEVTRKLRVRLADREVTSTLVELLGQEPVLKALKRMEKNLFGRDRENLSRLREELQRNELSDELISLLVEQNMGSFVLGALDRDSLDDVIQEARLLLANQTDFQVLDLKRRPFSESSKYWPAFAIALGSIALLSVGAWGVFRGKEL